MSTMSWQAWRYGELLGAACGVEVRLKWSGRPACGVWGAWVVHWRDGPTEAQMRAAASLLPRADPTGHVPRADELCYGRCLSTAGEATALLQWLERHPEALPDVGAVHLIAARDEVAYPERADPRTRARATALLTRGGGTLGYEVLRQLAWHARGGWPAVTAWLDGQAVSPMVVDLAAERARRRTR